MAYSVNLSKSAIRELDALAENVRTKVIEQLKKLAVDPRSPGTQKLQGRPEYKVRVGSFRIVFGIDDPNQTVTVYLIDDRKQVYRRLKRK